MKLLVFTKTTSIGPSSRVRYYAFVDPLGAHGIDLSISPLFGKGWFFLLRVPFRPLRLVLQVLYTAFCFARRVWALLSVSRYDGVVIEHQLFPYLGAFAERWLRRRGTRFTIEFDDAIYKTWRHEHKMIELCRLADRVIVGNRFLEEWARSHGARTVVIPTTIDLDRYPASDSLPTREGASPRDTTPFVVGWIGLPYNFAALATIAAPLRRLATTGAIELNVVSAGSPNLSGVPTKVVPWHAESELASIRRFHVGVMPLVDDEWSRGKCAYKILQYFAAGVPVVASPVGVNQDIVRHDENGLLARTEEEWYESLDRLRRDPSLGLRLATAGRETVERDFSQTAWTPKLAQAWREALAPPPPTG